MMAIIGMFFQDGLTGQAWGDWSAFTDSPLRAFENELGVQAPVGYWDPMGLAKDGNADEFRRRREVELKHGRVSMWAAVGYIVPEYFRWPGYCSPSEGLKFADIPNGLGALSKLSGNGLLQIFLFCGFLETNYFKQDPNRGAGDFENAGVLGVPGRRQTEIKHGRVSMLACMGYITPELTGKLPGYLSPSMGLKFADIPNGLGAISKVPLAGWGQILAYGAFCELSQDQSPGTPGAKGDFGFKVLTSSDPAEKEKKLAAEIANGRLAMMAIIGMFFQDGLTGSAWGDWALYEASPLRAFENELGVQPPVGFWDPLGFTAEGNAEDFARRRQTEIKHGRVSMLACMGYITPELTGKLPGYLSPSMGLKFADIPNGLGAISKVPLAGWGQILAYGAFCELSQDQS